MLKYIFKLVTQPSSFAGFGLIFTALPIIVASVSNPLGWAGLFAGLAAILKSE